MSERTVYSADHDGDAASGIKAALSKVETEILKNHAVSCVEEAIAAGDADAQRRKFSELVEVFAKAKL